jgi:hypothetical protein
MNFPSPSWKTRAPAPATMAVSPAHVRGVFFPVDSYSPHKSHGDEHVHIDAVNGSAARSLRAPSILSSAAGPSRHRTASFSLLKFRSPITPAFPTSRPRASSLSLSARPLPLERRPGPFIFLEVLGQGGCSTAYAARDECTGKVVCMKVFKKRPSFVERRVGCPLFQELVAYKALAEAEHPFVMQLHGIFQDADLVYFAIVRNL